MTPRAAFLRALPGHGFAPPEAAVAALGGELPAGALAERFAADVRAFAAAFWSLPPAERRARWEALAARAAGPAAGWLRELRRALDERSAAPADPAAAELAALACELVVLPPRARAARRVAWLTEHAAELPRHPAAAAAKLDKRLAAWLTMGAAPERIDRQTWVAIRDRWRARRRFVRLYLNPTMTPLKALGVLVVLSVVMGAWLEYNYQASLRRPSTPMTRSTGWHSTGRSP